MDCDNCGSFDNVVDGLCNTCFQMSQEGALPSGYKDQLELPFDDPRFEGSCAGGACDTGK